MPVRLTESAINKAIRVGSERHPPGYRRCRLPRPAAAPDSRWISNLGSCLSGSAWADEAFPDRRISRQRD